MPSTMFAEGIKRIMNGTIDLDTHVIKACLTKSSYNTTINKDTNAFLNQVPAGDRASGTFKVFTTPSILISAAADKVFFAENIVSITFPTVTNGTKVGGCVIFKSSSASTTTSPLICYCQLAANVTADGGTFTATLHANGLFQADYA